MTRLHIHLGIKVEAGEESDTMHTHLQQQRTVTAEIGTVCCYAASNNIGRLQVGEG
jgi:hypothetical protein